MRPEWPEGHTMPGNTPAPPRDDAPPLRGVFTDFAMI